MVVSARQVTEQNRAFMHRVREGVLERAQLVLKRRRDGAVPAVDGGPPAGSVQYRQWQHAAGTRRRFPGLLITSSPGKGIFAQVPAATLESLAPTTAGAACSAHHRPPGG
jgi:hypothetical protein